MSVRRCYIEGRTWEKLFWPEAGVSGEDQEEYVRKLFKSLKLCIVAEQERR